MVLPRGNTRYGLQNGRAFNVTQGAYADPYNNQQANRGMSERPRRGLGQGMASVPPGQSRLAMTPQNTMPGLGSSEVLLAPPVARQRPAVTPSPAPAPSPLSVSASRLYDAGHEEDYFQGRAAARQSLSRRNRAAYDSMGSQSPYMWGQREEAGQVASGAPAPTYRAGLQGITPSQQRQLAGPPADAPVGWTAEGVSPVEHRSMTFGKYSGAQGADPSFTGAGGRKIMVSSDPKTGVALKGIGGPQFVGTNGTTQQQYFASRREKEATKARQKQDLAMHDATISALKQAELEHHIKHASTLSGQAGAKYLAGVRSEMEAARSALGAASSPVAAKPRPEEPWDPDAIHQLNNGVKAFNRLGNFGGAGVSGYGGTNRQRIPFVGH